MPEWEKAQLVNEWESAPMVGIDVLDTEQQQKVDDSIFYGSISGKDPNEIYSYVDAINKDDLLTRAVKGYLNKSLLDIAEESRASTNVIDTMTLMTSDSMNKVIDTLPENPTLLEKIKGAARIVYQMNKDYFFSEEENVKRKATARGELSELRPNARFSIPEAETFGEKAVDVGTSLGAFITQIFVARKIIPAGTVIPDVTAWEIVNRINGGKPGEGAMMRGSLGAIGEIPVGSMTGKIEKVLAESGYFAGYTAATGGKAEDIIVSATIPVIFNAWAFQKQRSYINNFEKSLKQKALKNYDKQIREGNPESVARAHLEIDSRQIDDAVARMKQTIYKDDAFAPSVDKWELERQKALKMIASGKSDQVQKGKDILAFMEKTQPVRDSLGISDSKTQEIVSDIKNIVKPDIKVKSAEELGLKVGKKVEDGKVPETIPPTPAVEPQTMAEGKVGTPETGKPYTATLYRGINPEGPADSGYYGKATYYTPDKYVAEDYAKTGGYVGKESKTGEVIEREINLKNPFVGTEKDFEQFNTVVETKDNIGEYLELKAQSMSDNMKKAGYDGFILLYNKKGGVREVGVFYPVESQPIPPVEVQPEKVETRPEQMGGISTEIVKPNLYIGNVTPRMKKIFAGEFDVDPEDVKGFTEGGFPTKRTKIEMTRAEATNYLDWSMNQIDEMVKQVEETGTVGLTYNQLANTQALIGDIKELQDALGYTVQPAQITFRQAGKRRTAISGKPSISDARYKEITQKIEKGQEITEQDEADLIIALKEEQAFNKAVMKLNVKQTIQQAVNPQEPSGMTVQQVFNAVMKGKEQAAQKAYIEAGRDIVKQHKNLAAMAKDRLSGLKISEGQRSRLLNAVAKARTDAEQVNAMASVLAVADDAVLKEQKRRLKDLVKQIPKYGKQKALSDEAEQRIDELFANTDISKMSKAKRDELEQIKKELTGYGFEIADKFNETAQEELEGIEEVVGQNVLNNLKRLDKTSFSDMTVDEREEFIDTLDYVLSQNTKERQEYIKKESERAKEVERKSIEELIPTGKAVDTQVRSEKISLPKMLGNLLTIDSLKRWALVERLVGRKGSSSQRILDKDIHDGKNESIAINREALNLLNEELSRIGWSKTDIERLEKVHTITFGGKKYDLTTNEIMSLGMNVRYKRNLKQLLKAESLWINGKERNTPTLKEIYAAMEVLSEKEIAVMDFVPIINENVLMPAVNKTAKKLFGFGLAKDTNYWGLKRRFEKTVRGKVIEGPALEDLGMFQPFTGGSSPLIIKPFFSQLYTQIQNSASFSGMAIPMKRARTLLNSKSWRKAVDEAGYKEERIRLTEIYRRSQGMSNDLENIEVIAGTLLRRAGKAILGWRIPTMAIQSASLPMAHAIIPVKYGVPNADIKVQRGKEQTERMENYSPFLWLRHKGGRVEIVTGDYAAMSSVDNMIFNKKTDKSLEGLRVVDWRTIQEIDAMVQRWVADTTSLEVGSEAYWKEVATRTEEVVRKTQPVWDIDERSYLASSKNVFTKPVFMFRAAREAVLNLNIMAVDNVIKEGGSAKSLEDLAKTTSATLLSTSMVLAIRMAVASGIAITMASMLGKEPPDEEDLRLTAKDLALSFVNEMFGYLPLGSLAIALVKTIAKEPIYSELDPDQVMYSIPINTFRAVTDVQQAVKAYRKGDNEKAVVEIMDGLNKAIDAGSMATGYPLPGVTQITTKPLVKELKRKESSNNSIKFK